MTAPSVAEVMRSVSSRAPSMRWVGASDEMIQLSTTEPMVEPMKPPMVAAADAKDRAADGAANGGAGRTEDKGRHGASWSKGDGKTRTGTDRGRPATGGVDQTRATPAVPTFPHPLAMGRKSSMSPDMSQERER